MTLVPCNTELSKSKMNCRLANKVQTFWIQLAINQGKVFPSLINHNLGEMGEGVGGSHGWVTSLFYCWFSLNKSEMVNIWWTIIKENCHKDRTSDDIDVNLWPGISSPTTSKRTPKKRIHIMVNFVYNLIKNKLHWKYLCIDAQCFSETMRKAPLTKTKESSKLVFEISRYGW